MTKEILFHPAWDKRNPDSSKDYGIHCVELIFILKGEKGAVNFTLYTNWYLPKNRDNLVKNDRLFKYWREPMPADLGCHSLVPQYEGHSSIPNCKILDNKDCYYDGSTLNAEPVFETLIAEGSDGVWKELEEYYKQNFGELK